MLGKHPCDFLQNQMGIAQMGGGCYLSNAMLNWFFLYWLPFCQNQTPNGNIVEEEEVEQRNQKTETLRSNFFD